MPTGTDQLRITAEIQVPIYSHSIHLTDPKEGETRACGSSRENTGAVHYVRSLVLDTRPTSDRLRETLFNVLTAGEPERLKGSVWLDVYAGTGAVGIEALSRGAHSVTFVENNARRRK